MYRRSLDENLEKMKENLEDSRSYLMMLVSSLLELKKTSEKDPDMVFIEKYLNDLSVLDNILELIQEKRGL
jgi:hypothetical protein